MAETEETETGANALRLLSAQCLTVISMYSDASPRHLAIGQHLVPWTSALVSRPDEVPHRAEQAVESAYALPRFPLLYSLSHCT
eukprot:6196238-Pleurochrysis_carterae.AAC.3